MTQPAAWSAAERAARESYGRLVAWLAYRWRDLAAAEDALAEAFAAALETWPARGVPAAPDAWLLTAARNNLAATWRRARLAADPAVTILFEVDEAAGPPSAIPDDRLKLLFVCAHPAIDEKVRAALMLQTVLGLDAARVASAFLVSPSAMAQRLVRAKTKIRDSGIRFEEPEPGEYAERLDAVLDAIYAAYAAGWDAAGTTDTGGAHLIEEALFLGRLLVALLPGQPEPAGLLALMLFCEARGAARFDADGTFVPLAEQDTRLWDRARIAEADTLLLAAAAHRIPGCFQVEAAIQSAHSQRLFTGSTPWRSIALLYDVLATLAPTLGVLVSRAVAHAEAHGAGAGLALLDALDPAVARGYQPYWAARAHLASKAGLDSEASEAYERAIGLCTHPAVRAFLLQRRNASSTGQAAR